MDAMPHAAVDDHARLARGLTRLLTRRYAIALGAVAGLALIGQIAVQVAISHLLGDANTAATLDASARERILTLRWLELGLFVMLASTLALEALFVFRPAVRRVGTALVDLERVKRWAVEQEVAAASGRLERRIGSDLHDGLGQRLTGISLLAKALAKRLPEGPERDQAAAISREVGEAIAETRTLARQLFPAAAEAPSLGAALRDLAEATARRAGITCTCEWDDDLPLPRLPEEAETPAPMHLFRIVQEALTNSLRHGQAQHILITARVVDGRGTVEISDDGIGLKATASGESMGLGVRSMGYRCRLMGADLTISEAPEGGAVVRLSWPVGG